ncbi:hypothetical protein BHM03_00038159 [Ensete ventricosum]|nr:hypothetical protein BHM03_00038159 [Ensete ventricosum]
MCMQALRGRGAQLGNTIIASVKEAQPHGEVMQALRGRGAQLGNTIIASVKEAQPHGEVKKGDVASRWCGGACCHAKGRCCDGSEIKFDDNAVVFIDKQGDRIGTRVFRASVSRA